MAAPNNAQQNLPQVQPADNQDAPAVRIERNASFYHDAYSQTARDLGFHKKLCAKTLYAGWCGYLLSSLSGDLRLMAAITPALGLLVSVRDIKGAIHHMNNYIQNPNELIDVMENQGGEYPAYAYEEQAGIDARRISRNLTRVLGQDRQLIPIDTVRDDILQLVEITEQLSFSENQQGRLNEMLNSNANHEISLIWTYIEHEKTGDEQAEMKRQFVEHLALTQGCTHGRPNQVLLFFLGGIDPAILRTQRFPALVTRVPNNADYKNEMLSAMTEALTTAQRQGDLNINSTTQEEKAFLRNIFVRNRSYEHFNIDLRMTNRVFNQLFEELQAGLIPDV